jgi:hypothetical protein
MFETEESEVHRRIGVDNSYDLLNNELVNRRKRNQSMNNIRNTKSMVDAAWLLDPK